MERTRELVTMPDGVTTFEEEMDYLLNEYGFGRIDNSADVPADEDCDGIIEFEIVRKGGK